MFGNNNVDLTGNVPYESKGAYCLGSAQQSPLKQCSNLKFKHFIHIYVRIKTDFYILKVLDKFLIVTQRQERVRFEIT